MPIVNRKKKKRKRKKEKEKKKIRGMKRKSRNQYAACA